MAAATMMEQQGKQCEREAAAALLGERPPLPLAAPSDQAAAEVLLSAEAMLLACPSLHAAACAHAEV